MKVVTLSLALLFAAPLTAQPGERRFDVGRFDAIDLAGSDDVRVVPGLSFAVVASGDRRAVAALSIAVRGDTLHVGRLPGRYRDAGATVTVTMPMPMPMLRAATISGSGGFRASGVRGRTFAGRISGSGGMILTGLRVGSAQFDLGGSGSIVADGSADSVGIDLGGAGRIDTQRLATPVVVIELGGSGSVAATAARTAGIRAAGSGSVRVTGHPACDIRNTGTATVRCG